jgi:hypothetical protein
MLPVASLVYRVLSYRQGFFLSVIQRTEKYPELCLIVALPGEVDGGWKHIAPSTRFGRFAV